MKSLAWIAGTVVVLAFFGAFLGRSEQAPTVAPDEKTMKAAVLVVSAARGAAIACKLRDNGGWEAAMAYLNTLPMAQRQEFGEFLTGGVGGGMGITKDRNFPAICAGNTVPEMIAKTDWARRLLLEEAGRR